MQFYTHNSSAFSKNDAIKVSYIAISYKKDGINPNKVCPYCKDQKEPMKINDVHIIKPFSEVCGNSEFEVLECYTCKLIYSVVGKQECTPNIAHNTSWFSLQPTGMRVYYMTHINNKLQVCYVNREDESYLLNNYILKRMSGCMPILEKR